MFKIGDKVEALTDYPEHGGRKIIKGMRGVVLDPDAGIRGDNTLVHVMFDNGIEEYMFSYRLKLVKEEKEEMKFDMKKEPWYIRINSKAESKAVQEWLFSKGLGWTTRNAPDLTVKYENYKFICNIFTDGIVISSLLKTNSQGEIHESAKEIKPTFKAVVDSVTFPEVKTEQQKQIEELEKTILLAKQQIETLKKGE